METFRSTGMPYNVRIAKSKFDHYKSIYSNDRQFNGSKHCINIVGIVYRWVNSDSPTSDSLVFFYKERTLRHDSAGVILPLVHTSIFTPQRLHFVLNHNFEH